MTSERSAAQKVLAYLSSHPGSRDTLDGIAEWWLLEVEISQRLQVVKEALRQLVEEGFVIEERGPDRRLHYRLNQRKLDRIRQMLNE